MASGTGTSTAAAPLLLPLLVLVLFAAGARADDGAIEFSPAARARRAGPPVPVDGVVRAAEKENCPLVRVPSLVDACRSAPGLLACVSQCVDNHYRGGYCDMQANGVPGDCYCTNCLATTLASLSHYH